jgi:hypothetical protein
MEPKQIECSVCQSRNVRQLRQIQTPPLAAVITDGQAVHVPIWWEFVCDRGHRFNVDLALNAINR